VRSKASYFSISVPLIKENIRKLWALPVLAFLVYFLSGVFPILMTYKNLRYTASYIELSLHNMQPFFMGAHLLVPVIAAVLLYRYLQNVGSAAVMHSMPFTRSKLFNSNFLTGILLIAAPIIVNGIILLLISKPVFREYGYGENLSISTVNLFARGEIFNWMGTSLLIVFVLFSISVFTAIVTGNNLMHLLTSYFFIFLIPLLYMVFNVYFQEFLFGFDQSGNYMDIGLSISPYTSILSGGGYFSMYEVLYYIGTIVLMLVVSAFLYNKRKLERATDSLTFEFMKPIICYVIAFLGMTMLGFYFYMVEQERAYMYAGFAAGTIIFFIIGQMIVTKSPRIYNKEGLRSFIAYVLIALIFIAGLNFDVTGFERRVPSVDKLEGADFNISFGRGIYNKWGYYEEPGLSDPENLKALTDFHRSVIENRGRFEKMGNNLSSSSLRIQYENKGLWDMSRRYTVDYEFWAGSPDLKKIYESDEYKLKNMISGIKGEKFTQAYIYSDVSSGKENTIRNNEHLKELVLAMEKDYMSMTFEDFISLRPNYANIELQYVLPEENVIGRSDGRGYVNFNVPLNASNTIEWLKSHGYNFDLTAEMVEWIDIYDSKYEGEKASAYSEDAMIKESQTYPGNRPTLMRITDKEKINKILNAYDSQAIDYN
jgi:ABC-2 type transport system permease protein